MQMYLNAVVGICILLHLHFFVQFNLFDGCILILLVFLFFSGFTYFLITFFFLANDQNVENCRTQQNMEQPVRALTGLSAIQIGNKVRIILLTYLLADL